jgi:hypothetical protein
MLHDKIIAAIRTGCAVLGASAVTFLVSTLAGWGLEVQVDPELSSIIAVLMFGVLVALYNLLVGWLTDNVWDGFGWLLGVNKPPSYVEDDMRTEPEGVAVDVPPFDPYGDPDRA